MRVVLSEPIVLVQLKRTDRSIRYPVHEGMYRVDKKEGCEHVDDVVDVHLQPFRL